MTVRRPLVVLALAAVTLTAACSNQASAQQKRPHTGVGTASAQADSTQQITVTTGDDYRFHPSTLVVHPGRVRIVLKNTATSGPPHNLSVTGFPAAFVPLASAGGTQTATFIAPAPGRYRFVCTIHVNQGQTGTLVVEPAA